MSSSANDAIKSIPLQVLASDAVSLTPGAKQTGENKIARSPVKFDNAPILRKPEWIRVRIPSGNAVAKLKAKLRENRLSARKPRARTSTNASATAPPRS
jgi:lipoic acid synthetase